MSADLKTYARLLAQKVRAREQGIEDDEEAALLELDAIWPEMSEPDRVQARALTRALGQRAITLEEMEAAAPQAPKAHPRAPVQIVVVRPGNAADFFPMLVTSSRRAGASYAAA